MQKTTYRIIRTSTAYTDQSPCEEALQDGENYYVTLSDEELVAFCRKYNRVIVNMRHNSLEIYDCWRE